MTLTFEQRKELKRAVSAAQKRRLLNDTRLKNATKGVATKQGKDGGNGN